MARGYDPGYQISDRAAVRLTLDHYAKLSAQRTRERAKADGDTFAEAQCRKCGLFHASAPCHPYSDRIAKGDY